MWHEYPDICQHFTFGKNVDKKCCHDKNIKWRQFKRFSHTILCHADL